MWGYVPKEEYMALGTKRQKEWPHLPSPQGPTEGHFLPYIPATLSSAELEVLVSREVTLLPELHAVGPSTLNHKCHLPPAYFGLLMSEDQQTRVTILAEITEPEQPEVAGMGKTYAEPRAS